MVSLRWQRRILQWSTGAGTVGFLLFLGFTLLNLRSLAKSMEAFALEEAHNHARLVALVLQDLPPEEWDPLLTSLVQAEVAVYLAVVDSLNRPMAWASAFEGYLPLASHSDSLRFVHTPLGRILEMHVPLAPGQRLVLGYPYFLYDVWWRRSLSLAVAGVLAFGGLLALIWIARERMRQRVEAQEQQIRRLETERQQFRQHLALAREIAHEIKNPLNVLALGIQQLEEVPAAEQSRYRRLLLREIQGLGRRVEALLEIQRPLEIRPQPIRVSDLVADLRDLYGPLLQEHGKPLRVEAETGVLWADPDLLRQALANLLQNALQHALPGPVALRVRRQGEGWLFEVEDSGPGIPEDLRDRVFLPGVTTTREGSGIGLARVKRIALAHGGWAQVVPGSWGGSRFQLWIPHEEAHHARRHTHH